MMQEPKIDTFGDNLIIQLRFCQSQVRVADRFPKQLYQHCNQRGLNDLQRTRFLSPLTPHLPPSPPHASVISTLATHRKFRKRNNLLTRWGCGKGAKSYDNEKPWSSINYSIFSYYNATNWHPLHLYSNCLAKVFKEFF